MRSKAAGTLFDEIRRLQSSTSSLLLSIGILPRTIAIPHSWYRDLVQTFIAASRQYHTASILSAQAWTHQSAPTGIRRSTPIYLLCAWQDLTRDSGLPEMPSAMFRMVSQPPFVARPHSIGTRRLQRSLKVSQVPLRRGSI